MSSSQDYEFALYLSYVNFQIPIIFSYFVPWIGLAVFAFATVILIVRKRTEENLLIYIFQWQYAIGVIFWLNMIFIDHKFTTFLFKYNFHINFADIICKLITMISTFINCLSPWMQVVTYLFNHINYI